MFNLLFLFDPEPDPYPYLWLMNLDADPGGPKPYTGTYFHEVNAKTFSNDFCFATKLSKSQKGEVFGIEKYECFYTVLRICNVYP